jgi:hypothetical protein
LATRKDHTFSEKHEQDEKPITVRWEKSSDDSKWEYVFHMITPRMKKPTREIAAEEGWQAVTTRKVAERIGQIPFAGDDEGSALRLELPSSRFIAHAVLDSRGEIYAHFQP